MKNISKDGSDFSPTAETFVGMAILMRGRLTLEQRKTLFDGVMALENYRREGDVFFMKGAQYSETERQTAQKLSGSGYYVVFPSRGQLKTIGITEKNADNRRNDVYIYDKKTYRQSKAELKTSGEPSTSGIAGHLASGSGQAPVIVLDITGKINKKNLIKGIRAGWNRGIYLVLLNYKGQWYDINRERAFDTYWMNDSLP
jgi:hypothetical protein